MKPSSPGSECGLQVAEGFLQAIEALAHFGERQAQQLVLLGHPTGSDAQEQAAA